MTIQYTFQTNRLTEENLQQLFASVEWESANYPERLYHAMLNSHSVIMAWDKDRLVGLANALSDDVMTVYFHYVLTDPEYQGQGIGRRMMQQILAKYETYYTKVLVAYPKAITFYARLGFTGESDSLPMYLYKK